MYILVPLEKLYNFGFSRGGPRWPPRHGNRALGPLKNHQNFLRAPRTTAPPAHKAGPDGPSAKGSLGANGQHWRGSSPRQGMSSGRVFVAHPGSPAARAVDHVAAERGDFLGPRVASGPARSPCARHPRERVVQARSWQDGREGCLYNISNQSTPHSHPHHTSTIHTPHCSRIHVATS